MFYCKSFLYMCHMHIHMHLVFAIQGCHIMVNVVICGQWVSYCTLCSMGSFLSMMVFQKNCLKGYLLLTTPSPSMANSWSLHDYFENTQSLHILRDIPCSVEVQAVIEQLLELESSKRMTVSALLQELQSIMSRWSVICYLLFEKCACGIIDTFITKLQYS